MAQKRCLWYRNPGTYDDASLPHTLTAMITLSRLPFVFLAKLSLLFGLWTGLNRIGWDLTPLAANMHHGAIMVGGFLGTLICLEKIIPLKNKFLYIIPVFSAASVAFFLSGHPRLSFSLLVLSASGLSAVFLWYLLKEKNRIYVLATVGSLCWLNGNLLLASKTFYPLALPWWLGFALFIITSERLELAKFLPVSRPLKQLLISFLALYILGALLSFHGTGHKISGLALIAVSLWLMRYDIVAISIRKEGLPKFVAVALLTGYIAMLFTGIFFLALRDQALAYDAIVHTFFLGFVFSMIFAHGPIILPGVLGMSVKPYHPVLYAWLLLLHLSWVMRIAGDIFLEFEVRKYSAIVSSIGIVGYFASVAALTISQRRHA